jgi:large subunit ribosomal protein L29
MKTKELKLMNEPDLENKIAELRKELMKINSQIAIGMSPKNPSKAGEIKKTIAKILTIRKENSAKSGGIKKE